MQFCVRTRLQSSTVIAVLLDTNERDRQREASDKKLDGGREGRGARDDHAETSSIHDEPQNVDDGREEDDLSDDRAETI